MQIEAPARKPAAFTRRPRVGGAAAIDQYQVHATRGQVAMALQVQATVNWLASTALYPHGNSHDGSWGGSAEFVIGPLDGRTVIIKFGDWKRTFSSWSAGSGAGGFGVEHGAATRGVAIELAQPPRRHLGRYLAGDSDVPFEDETIDALVWLIAELNDDLAASGGRRIPYERIAYWPQLLSAPVPRGLIGHADLANGRKLGKSDPGAMFPWADLLSRLEAEDAQYHAPAPEWSRLNMAVAVWNGKADVKPLTVIDGVARYEVARRL